MYHHININHILKEIMLQVLNKISHIFRAFKKNHDTKHVLHDHYRCKIKNQKAMVIFKPNSLLLKVKNQEQEIAYTAIKEVGLKIKWWRIRVLLKTKNKCYNFDLANLEKANKLYEALIYKKVENRL